MSYQFAGNQNVNGQTSSFGLAPNIAALLSYVWIPVTSIIILLTEKGNRTVRFHAFQSLFLGLAVIAASIALSVISGILGGLAAVLSPTLGLLVAFGSLAVWLVFTVALFAAWIICLIKAYRGEIYQLPVIGRYASDISGK